MNLKTLGVPYIICKAHDDTYREILEKLGADRVIIPEWEMADKLTLGLTSTGVLEYIELSDQYGIVEMTPPESWVGKSIRNLALRTKYGINILAMRRQDQLNILPNIDEPIDAQDTIVLLGSYDVINQLRK